ncbi:DUF1800 domain-containing protein [Actinomarinicola tropica]|uniref:DUF1800 domain-containing protein n=1 Tax=Actinomarinicola tropica TaxID=2789776 RepID=UPI00189A2888|nr:DUF1800 domain-containing protein [Actinomarinicola tropica]
MPTPTADVAHLLRRAGFGAPTARVATLAAEEWADLVDLLLDAGPAPADPYPGTGTTSSWNAFVAMIQAWIDRMANGPTPLLEKMTLIWHGHLTTSLSKTYEPAWLWEQNRVLRRNALGNLRTMLKEVAVTPAMLDYLDNRHNRVGAPNENWARELMELFVLGAGSGYTQDDVVAMSRAWTGHTIDGATRTYRFRSDRHDSGQKTLLGVTRNWDGPEAIDHLLDGPLRMTAARFVARKVFAHLAHPSPSSGTVDALATTFAASDWDIRTLVRSILLHADFRSTAARQGLVRAPVEFAAAVTRCSGLPVGTVHPEWWLHDMGQRPFDPPNVSGWRQNEYWLTTSAMGVRFKMARNVTWGLYEDPNFLPGFESGTPTQVVSAVCDRFEVTPSPATRTRLEAQVSELRAAGHSWAVRPNLITLVMVTPEFNLA